MVDTLTLAERSRLMGRVRGKDTRPELVVRRLAHALGYRFRLHHPDLAGKPDLAFPRRKKVIFVHGCYWHRHNCKKATTPKSNVQFWQKKFDENMARDMRNVNDLAAKGWEALIVWECETKEADELANALLRFLGPRP